MITEENRLIDMKRYMSNLQQLHLSRNKSLNLHSFINDLLIIIQNLLDNLDSRQWQAAINNCINSQCPWFKFSNTNQILFYSTTNISLSSNSNFLINHCIKSPSIDHTYSLNNDKLFFQSNLYKNHLLTSNNSLLRYMNNKFENDHSFENFYQIDTRLCQLCQTYADHFSLNISRLISIGINQWVHIGCILPIYSKILNQSPYILNNINEMINRCQTKLKCDICFKMGASVRCYINDCQTYFHCQCIEIYYSKIEKNLQEKLNIINGLLPNLNTLCIKHSKQILNENESNNNINLHKMKSINLSSPIYADLSNTSIEFSFTNIKLCIGSLQIHSFGNFDYLLDNDPNPIKYPNGYHASRIFWSTKNACQKTVYHLYININQTYHNEKSNHQTLLPLSKPLNKSFSKKQFSIDTKTFRSFLNNPNNSKSSNISQLTLEILQAFQLPTTKINYYFSNKKIPQLDGNYDENNLIDLYNQWLKTKFGQIKFTIMSNDGYKIISENLDQSWLKIVNLVCECRDDMNLTHLSMTNDELNGHQIFGLKNSIIKIILNQILINQNSREQKILLSNLNISTKKLKRKFFSLNSRLNIYKRKSSKYQRFNWLLNPNRTIQNALNTFEIDDALAYSRRILLEKSSISFCLSHLNYFSERVLIVGSSSIHGCGLFTLIDLFKGQMIIEYKGEVIRTCLTDKRENENEKKGFGCYMFTVDSMNVIDATHQGNKARFINHHCQPNCFAKTVISNGIKHIIIYALQNITHGSELTYDYSFPEEDIKIPCNCGTSQCRIYLN